MAQNKSFKLGSLGGGSTKCCCGTGGGVACGLCNLPATNLTLTFVMGATSKTCTMVWDALNTWWLATSCFNVFGYGGTFKLVCSTQCGSPSMPQLLITCPLCVTCCNSCTGAGTGKLTPTSYACSPLQLVYDIASAAGGTNCSCDCFGCNPATITITP